MNKNQQETRNLLILSAIVDFTLGVVKIAIGLFANSYALVVDGIHSLSDLITDGMVWLFNAIGSQDPDDDHPYGHARFETFGTFSLGVLLVFVAAFIVYESAQRIVELDSYAIPEWPALAAAVLSIIAKEWLYRRTFAIGKRQNSRLLQANAWHHRTDSLSSIIVLIGILGALGGFPWIELIAAIGVGLMIAFIGWDLIKTSASELVDTALSETYVDAIKTSTENVEGVRRAHSIRTRRMGNAAIVELHLQVKPAISVSEGHHIGEWVSRTLEQQFQEINDVIVHIDAEDDEVEEARQQEELSPLRAHVKEELFIAWREILPQEQILKLDLHYLDNQVDIEIYTRKNSLAVDSGDLKQAANDLTWLGNITIWLESSVD